MFKESSDTNVVLVGDCARPGRPLELPIPGYPARVVWICECTLSYQDLMLISYEWYYSFLGTWGVANFLGRDVEKYMEYHGKNFPVNKA